jgi:hypothetical protein
MKNKIQQKIYAIFQTLKTYASKLRISSFVGGQFKKREPLRNKIRKMILRFINNIQDKVLTTYHITLDFNTKENKPTFYRLELLAELRNDLECALLINQLRIQLSDKFNGYKTYVNELKTEHERLVIERNFIETLKTHVSMKFIFRQWVTTFSETPPLGYKTINVIDNTIPINGVKNYRVNILKTGEISFSAIKDMFCIEIDTTDFKGEDK